MPYLCVVTGDDSPAPTIAVELSDEHGAVDLKHAFGRAKICAGWEAHHLTKLDGLQETGLVILASKPWMPGEGPRA